MSELKHDDCMNFVPVDVAKGICRLTNQLILIDSPVCPKCTNIPKCKFCSHFEKSETERFIGTCKAGKKPVWCYEDLKACNCEGYTAK